MVTELTLSYVDIFEWFLGTFVEMEIAGFVLNAN